MIVSVMRPINPAILAIGNFDGVHLGHQKILEKTLEIAVAKNLKPILLTFEPYPPEFFHPEQKNSRLSSLREKINFIRENFFHDVIVLKFNSLFSRLSPQQFIQEILIKQLNAQQVVIGEDFRFGHQRAGNPDILKAYLPVEIVPPVFEDQKRISSTWIRKVLEQSDFALAKKLLGREYSLMGKVVQGQQRGRLLGFPTANMVFHRRKLPLSGVFAVKVNQRYSGIANLGVRPTVTPHPHASKIFLEVHLFDENIDLYQQWLKVEFLGKIRDEKRFDSLEALTQQIHQDVLKARELILSQA